MPFTANPFDYKGHLDTSAPDGQKSGYSTVAGDVNHTDTADNSAAFVVAAFRDATLAADAANRKQPGQAIPSPSAP
jgi:hypothetical protein